MTHKTPRNSLEKKINDINKFGYSRNILSSLNFPCPEKLANHKFPEKKNDKGGKGLPKKFHWFEIQVFRRQFVQVETSLKGKKKKKKSNNNNSSLVSR